MRFRLPGLGSTAAKCCADSAWLRCPLPRSTPRRRFTCRYAGTEFRECRQESIKPTRTAFSWPPQAGDFSVYAGWPFASRYVRSQAALEQGRRSSCAKLYLGQQRTLLGSPWKFCAHGQSGIEVSELFPHTAAEIDDICVIRSMVTDDPNHPGGCLLMNTGGSESSRPSIGAWVTYGLGTENQNLPGFMAIGPGPLIEGARQYGASFLPAAYQGTFVTDLSHPLRNLQNLQTSPSTAPRTRRTGQTQCVAPGRAARRHTLSSENRLLRAGLSNAK